MNKSELLLYQTEGGHTKIESGSKNKTETKMGLREIKAELNNQDKKDLIMIISNLYNKYKPIRESLDFFANPN